MKNKYIIPISFVLILFSVAPVFAESSATDSALPATSFFNIKDISELLKNASNSAERKDQQLQNIIKGADMMISNRINTLNNLNARIQGDKRLDDSEKTSLTNDIQTAITGLNSLKITIDADTDPAKARSDAKQIVTNYRIYEELEPKIRLLVTLNNLKATSTNVGGLIPQIQNLINTLSSQGKDVSQLNSLLSDINSQLTTINSTITADIAALNGLSVTSTDLSTTFSQIKNDITQIIKSDFGKIRSDFSTMKEVFHQDLGGNSSTASPSAENKNP